MKDTMAFQIAALYRDFLSYAKKELKQLGLSFGLMPIVIYTGKHPGCAHSDMTREMGLDWGYSQRSVSKLCDSDFLVREFDESSSCHHLTLTARGRQAFDVCHSVFSDWDQMKEETISPEEKELIIKLLRKLAA